MFTSNDSNGVFFVTRDVRATASGIFLYDLYVAHTHTHASVCLCVCAHACLHSYYIHTGILLMIW